MALNQFLSPAIIFLAIAPVPLIVFMSDGRIAGLNLVIYGLVLLATCACGLGIVALAKLIKSYRDREDILLSGMTDGVCSLDASGAVDLWNRSAEILTGRTRKDAQGKQYSDFFRLNSTSSRTRIDELLDGSQEFSSHAEAVGFASDGRSLPLALFLSPIHDENGMLNGVLVIFRDTSRQQKIDQAKNDFVSLASHQLRTPLTAVQWYLELLLDGDAGPLNRKQRDIAKRAYAQAIRMAALLRAFLNISRVEMGSLALAPKRSDLHTAIKAILAEYREEIKKKGLTLKTSWDIGIKTFSFDPLIIRIVLENLLSNAIAYTPSGGKVTVSTERSPRGIQISVGDTGYGIPLKDHDRIFTKLFRAENVRTLVPDGNGLGLSIVKGALDACHGSISFVSEEGKGTCFTVMLPKNGMQPLQGTRSLTPRPRS